MQQGRRADSVEARGVELRTRVKRLGVKRRSEKEEVQGEILAYQEEQGLPKDLHEGGSKKVATSGCGASKNVESTCSRDSPHRKIQIEEADCSSSSSQGRRGQFRSLFS